MNEEKTQELLLRMLEDLTIVKEKVNVLDELKEGVKLREGKIEQLEIIVQKHEKQISSLENRNNELEKFVRNGVSEQKRTQTSAFISIGVAVLTAVITFIFNLL